MKAQDGAIPASAAGMVIIGPETVHGAKTTSLCQVINVIGTVDGTTVAAGSWGVDVDVIMRIPLLSPSLVPVLFRLQRNRSFFSFQPRGTGENPWTEAFQVSSLHCIFEVFNCVKVIPFHPHELVSK